MNVRPWMKTVLWAVLGLTAAGWTWRSMGSMEVDDPADLLAERADRKPAPTRVLPVQPYPGASPVAVADAEPGRGARLSAGQPAIDIFRSRRWFVQPPPPPAPPPPPPAAPPVAAPQPATMPPLPFVVIGRMDTGADVPKVFINQHESVQVVSVGDVIDATYRIDAISRSALQMTYLPTQQAVTLPVAGVPR